MDAIKSQLKLEMRLCMKNNLKMAIPDNVIVKLNHKLMDALNNA